MRLKRLELQGFKSFVDKTEISFEDGITAVVGPNGSGKSNISDALRWVLGEQSAKTLRGSKMGDVIFAGTEKRTSVGFCKVSLVFENEERWLNIDYSEVAVTRKYYKSGESEYYINGSQCRLKDVLELFRDTGVGKEGYSIIGQNQVTDILSTGGAERRMAFEAATGILKYKSRKSDAQSRLAKTGENIDRLNDLLDEINMNLENLEQQSKQAKEYVTCKEKLKKYELARFMYKTKQSTIRADELKNELQDIDKNISGLEVQQERLRAEKNKILEEIKSETEKEQKLKESYISIREEIFKSGTKQEVTSERIKSIADNITAVTVRNDELRQEIDELTGQVQQDKNKLAELSAILEETRTELQEKNQHHEQLKAVLNENQQKLDDLKQRKILFLNSVSEVNINVSKYNTMLEAVKNRMEDITLQKKYISEKLSEFEMGKDRLKEQLAIIQENKDNLEETKRLLTEKEQGLVVEKNSLLEFLHIKDVELGAAKSKLNLLKNMQQDYEGYNFAVKNLLKLGEKDGRVQSRIRGTVADIIYVEKEYVVAVETALGAALQNVVTDTEEDAKALINVLKSNSLGRATFLPISSVKPSFLNKEEHASMNAIDGVIGCGAELVDYDSAYKPVIQKLLGRTVVVKNVDTAIKLMRKTAFRFQTVTLDGEIIHAGGAMTGGSKGKKSTGILGRSDEIASLEQSIMEMEKKTEESSVRLKGFDEGIYRVKEQFTQNKQRLKEIYDKNDELQNELSILYTQIDGETEKLALLNEESEQLTDNKIDIEDKLKLVSGKQKNSELSVDEKEIEELSKYVYDLRGKNEKSYGELSGLAADISGMEKDVASLERDIERGSKDIQTKKLQIEKNQANAKSLEAELSELNKTIDESSEQSKKSAVLEEKLKKDIDDNGNIIYLLQTKLKDNEASIEQYSDEIRENTDRRYKIDVEMSKMLIEAEMLDKDIFERYDLSYDDVAKMEFDISEGLYKKEIDSLKEHIKEMGNVNLNSIDEYAYTHARHEQITAQLGDLMDSKRDLEELIEVLQRDMTTQFKEQFKLINLNFGKIFQSLFGGGKAELILNKNESVLESDIDIVAQPPGKKLKSISLLSGGEKSLTAIAILFAMLELKPTPFCVLDEIESALDEANVHSFAKYLKNYSGKTQFLVITHKRGVMELSDAIYGVAMQEKGVSKVVSIKMPDDKKIQEEDKRGVI